MSDENDIALPDYAYVPGQTARHESGAFDHLTRSAQAGQSPAELASSLAWRSGLRFLRNGFYWEAHEVLEAVWMSLPEGSDDKQLVQALIQYANAALKQKMQRFQAADRLGIRAQAHFRAGRTGALARALSKVWPGAESDLNALLSAN